MFNETSPCCYFFDNEDNKPLCINLRISKWSSDLGFTTIDVWKNDVVDPILSLIDADGAYTTSSSCPIAYLMSVRSTNARDIIHEHKNVSRTCLLNHVHLVSLKSSSRRITLLSLSYNLLQHTATFVSICEYEVGTWLQYVVKYTMITIKGNFGVLMILMIMITIMYWYWSKLNIIYYMLPKII